MTVLDLGHYIKTPQIHSVAFPFRELGPYDKCPVVKPSGDYFRCQAVGGLLDGFGIISGKKRVVVFPKGNAEVQESPFDIIMAVKITGGLKRKKRSHADTHGAQFFVTDVEIIMGKSTAAPFHNAIIGILGGVFGLD